jgi:hypothetical protein
MTEKDRHDFILNADGGLEERRAEYAREAARMTRAYRVRGGALPAVCLLTSVLFLLWIPLWVRACAASFQPLSILFFGILLSLVAIPFHLLGGSRSVIPSKGVGFALYCVGIAVNVAGASLCASAYYAHLQVVPSPSVLLVGGLAAFLLCGLTALFMGLFPDAYGLVTGIAALVALGGLITATVFWIRSDSKVLFSTVFFILLWVLIALMALRAACGDEGSPWIRFASFASFGLLIAVGAVVLLILICAAGGDSCDCNCDGGCCDGGDCGGGGGSKKRKTK